MKNLQVATNSNNIKQETQIQSNQKPKLLRACLDSTYFELMKIAYANK
jgi:hypothetical protein